MPVSREMAFLVLHKCGGMTQECAVLVVVCMETLMA
jgi:hypothetical protein